MRMSGGSVDRPLCDLLRAVQRLAIQGADEGSEITMPLQARPQPRPARALCESTACGRQSNYAAAHGGADVRGGDPVVHCLSCGQGSELASNGTTSGQRRRSTFKLLYAPLDLVRAVQEFCGLEATQRR